MAGAVARATSQGPSACHAPMAEREAMTTKTCQGLAQRRIGGGWALGFGKVRQS